MSRKKNIDATDILILNQLQRNAAVTNAELAREIGLSEGPTLTRTRKLMEKKAINGIEARINYNYFGYSFRAMVIVKLPKTHLEQFKALLRGSEFVLRASCLKNRVSFSDTETIVMDVIAKSEKAFVKGMAEGYASLPFVVDFDVHPIGDVIKDTTAVDLTMDDVG